ncbi:MAG: DUF4855 domain-containing protein [Clostridium sp.]|nr:DUF4855 domain-containing protein [Bacteroides sp.]MCM1198623.1 DUF4855 domain-containing protein [Clostridium sp.]
MKCCCFRKKIYSVLCRQCAALAAVFAAVSCGNGYDYPDRPIGPDNGNGGGDREETVWLGDEKERVMIPSYRDMVLAYGGSPHRGKSSTWDTYRFRDYLLYEDKAGKKHLLFDSFLFLEFMYAGSYNGLQATNHTFTVGYKYDGVYLDSATKEDWQTLIDYYFETSALNPSISPLDALDKAFGEVAAELGIKGRKCGVVITVPEPIKQARHDLNINVYWGQIDGEEMNFMKSADRIRAVKWYIDSVREAFYSKEYENLELGGFYWIAESAATTSDILHEIGDYLGGFKYSFNWIPYYNANGFSRWSEFGFNTAYLQPNYFFDVTVPYSRLDDACRTARENGMNLEMEFDDNVLAGKGKAGRLRNYMKAFKEYGAWDTQDIAYYVGGDAVRDLKNSSAPDDRELYHEFCNWVVSRPVRIVQ